ncbi:type II toxin-antitoxin system RelE/ParE family toxin [Rhizobium skierniewicense]|uniref:type II toxin-antitoxin system RelE/ParE family toxin n=1 Tax=Rhizobium skierniewicense TaxID=984260 RepID=UPI0015744A1D|nr:type II toxin-antitoxin system RelE/ParE family toxin [Rhizobium skierniewicense]NTF31444.1 type II toxin-antitoxin system RelE/ParE family toxin [Rhizobium skierniewicense]
MKTYLLTPKAQVDLEQIWDYTEQNWGVLQAEIYVQFIRRTIEGLTDGSIISKSATHVREDYRKTLAGSHVIFFKENSETISVVRILHQRMDTGRI